MANIAVIYGSTTGNTQTAAERIQAELDGADIYTAGRDSLNRIGEYDAILFGASTWGFGDLQDDWDGLIGDLASLDLKGKKVAFFGTGDQEGFGDTYADSLGILYDALSGSGADFIGSWPTDGYSFSESKAVREGVFVGLALDEDNQSDLTSDRIARWVQQIKKEIAR